jgi:hypothetical protein
MQCVSVAFMVRIAFLCCLGALMICVTGCRGHSSAQEVGSVEPYISDPNSVGFDISPLPSNDRSRRWLATYSDQNKTAKFTIEIGPSAPTDSEADRGLKMSSGSGAILAVADSHASTMLVALAKALEAKHVPTHIQRASRLPFTYVILGESNSQAGGGGFSAKPTGNWTAMKIFIGDGKDEAEVFLNLNPVSRKGQFSEKDIDYGDTVLAKLATVL